MILLENNVPWVADGLRSLGSSMDRREFQSMLVTMLRENHIEYVHVKEDDYDTLPALRRAGEADAGQLAQRNKKAPRRFCYHSDYFAMRLYLIRFGSSASAPRVRFLYSSYSVKLPSKNSTLPSS